MSYALEAGVVTMFQADTTLKGLLAPKADGSASVYPFHFRDVQDPAYPLITIARFGQGVREDMFDESPIFATNMDNPKIAICVYDKANIDNCWLIFNRVNVLLRGDPPVTAIPSHYMTNYRMRRKQVRDDLFDTETNAYHLHSEWVVWVMNNPVNPIAP